VVMVVVVAGAVAVGALMLSALFLQLIVADYLRD
jgi:hypothetical protein